MATSVSNPGFNVSISLERGGERGVQAGAKAVKQELMEV
jgi:hypothetical protein